jgi:predicted metal-dependent RNase
MDLTLMALGAGQEVGRSCIMIHANSVNVMLDCGLHLGHQDKRRVPDFDVIGGAENINTAVQVVFITHFHLDHIGALPFLTEVVGYTGPVLMTRATQALAQLMLEDYCGLCRERCATPLNRTRSPSAQFKGTNFPNPCQVKCVRRGAFASVRGSARHRVAAPCTPYDFSF